MGRVTIAELRAKPPKLSAAERGRLDAMTDEDIERNAENDPDNPPMTDEELDRAVFARSVRQLREHLGLTQHGFAKRYRITLPRLKDWEQGRYKPDSVSLAYLKTIRHNPEAVLAALDAED